MTSPTCAMAPISPRPGLRTTQSSGFVGDSIRARSDNGCGRISSATRAVRIRIRCASRTRSEHDVAQGPDRRQTLDRGARAVLKRELVNRAGEDTVARRQIEQFGGGIDRWRQRLLDEHMTSCPDRRNRQGNMRRRRRADVHDVHVCQHVTQRGHGARSGQARGEPRSAIGVDVDDGDDAATRAQGCLGMPPAHQPCADDGDARRTHRVHRLSSRAGHRSPLNRGGTPTPRPSSTR